MSALLHPSGYSLNGLLFTESDLRRLFKVLYSRLNVEKYKINLNSNAVKNISRHILYEIKKSARSCLPFNLVFVEEQRLNLDSQILECIKSGKNDRVLAHLYESTLKKVKYYILKNGGNSEQAKDIFQDAVIILFNQVRKNKFEEKFSIDAFVFTVAKNLWITSIRRSSRMDNHEDMSIFGSKVHEKDLLSDLINKEKSAAISQLFSQLNEKCRLILHYYNHERWSMKEISEKLGYTNENVAKSSHYRCKLALMRLISGNKELENLLRN